MPTRNTTPIPLTMHRRNLRSGQALVMITMSLFFLFSVVGLAVDIGYSYFLKERLQTAADAAAIAAASYAKANGDSCATLSCPVTYTCSGASASSAVTAGCLYATADGPASMSATIVEGSGAPSGLSGVTPTIYTRATVTATNPMSFLALAGFKSATIAAQSTAGVIGGGSAGTCIYALSTTGVAFTDASSGNLNANCDIYSNSDLYFAQSGNVTTAGINYMGCYTNFGSGNISPAPTKVTSPVSDPFSTVPMPTVPTTCTQTNYTFTGTSLPAGTYCDGLNISGSQNITLASGQYIINGGSLKFTGSGNVTGTNVTFFITGGQNGHVAGPVSFSNSGNLNLSAPSSGTYQGILFYQDRSVTYSSPNTLAMSGNGNTTGSFYFPTTEIDYSSSGNQSTQVLVGNVIKMAGSGNFSKDTTGTKTGLVKVSAGLLQ